MSADQNASHFWSRLKVAWLRFLDRVKPRPGIGGPSPRVVTLSPAETARVDEILLQRSCNHEYVYMERQAGETYTGYCEQCLKCGRIVQVPQ